MAILNYQPPTNPWLNILYRDNDILVMDKPSGLLSVPGKELKHKDSLAVRVNRVFPTATVVHRLDMATSGIMLFALNKPAHKHIGQQFEKRLTKKCYLAKVYGNPGKDDGSIELPLICDWPNRPKQKVDRDNGKHALTHWQILERFEQHSLVKLTPVTGRSHQLRVHMLSLGHPILGDRLYAHESALAMAERLQLHATRLELEHPTTKEWLRFESKPEFAKTLTLSNI